MTDERLILAIGRIERALSRLESRTVTPAADPGKQDDLARRYGDLEQRHARLRSRTEAAIDRLSALLAAPRDS